MIYPIYIIWTIIFRRGKTLLFKRVQHVLALFIYQKPVQIAFDVRQIKPTLEIGGEVN